MAEQLGGPPDGPLDGWRLRLAYRESTVFTGPLRRQIEAFQAVRPDVRITCATWRTCIA